ncbi:MAG TPA: hydrogenase nickel incorporation protein HypB [Syntrophomonadaceae bacterium]|nr:hydrogenase nickel incorporation protein HypB [Syntrophomonadaceae bacterium]HQA06922.1 hydrogenase nickel incorporation protein HypB [Syntrophomonadaceae bacterium]HQE24360.1 hydrogenase nickel incorporation protein HypB [Syntrophomonadaceae bacterium]
MSEIRIIEVKQNILANNDKQAEKLRDSLHKQKTFLLNLMSSPGSGKTSVILSTIERLRDKLRIGVMEADIDSAVDAEKMAAVGVQAVQLRTGGLCHLDSTMTSQGLKELDLDNLDLVIIENIGNLVCPAEFDTGAVKNAMILSIPEGDDKPLKYPLMFSTCDALLINKIDYLGIADFDVEAVKKRVYALNPDIKIFEVSAKTGQGMEAWADWLYQEVLAWTES